MSRVCADAGIVARRRVTTHDEVGSVSGLGHGNSNMRCRRPDHLEKPFSSLESFSNVTHSRLLLDCCEHRKESENATYLRVMPIASKIPLPDFLPMVRLFLIHPRLARIRQAPTGTRPVQVLSLAGSLGAGTVLEAGVFGDQMLRPLLRRGGEVGVPDQVGTVDRGAFGDSLAS